MTNNQKALNALRAVEKGLQRKYNKGYINHYWTSENCQLCRIFDKEHHHTCVECPFEIFRVVDSPELGCYIFARCYYEIPSVGIKTPIDETMSIIKSFIQYYEEVT